MGIFGARSKFMAHMAMQLLTMVNIRPMLPVGLIAMGPLQRSSDVYSAVAFHSQYQLLFTLENAPVAAEKLLQQQTIQPDGQTLYRRGLEGVEMCAAWLLSVLPLIGTIVGYYPTCWLCLAQGPMRGREAWDQREAHLCVTWRSTWSELYTRWFLVYMSFVPILLYLWFYTPWFSMVGMAAFFLEGSSCQMVSRQIPTGFFPSSHGSCSGRSKFRTSATWAALFSHGNGRTIFLKAEPQPSFCRTVMRWIFTSFPLGTQSLASTTTRGARPAEDQHGGLPKQWRWRQQLPLPLEAARRVWRSPGKESKILGFGPLGYAHGSYTWSTVTFTT